jgi:hypothetical protein
MKLAMCYTVYNGLELLMKSVQAHYNLVDEIIICYQTISNKGNVNNEVEDFVKYRFGGKSKVHIIKFRPDFAYNTKANERRKHNMMLDKAREIGCSHIVLSATDHFYKVQDFLDAKAFVIAFDYDVTFTDMYTYYKKPEWQLTPIENYAMPFIIKLHPDTKIEYNKNFPVHVDPSVQVNTYKTWHKFPEDFCMLHHYSMIREDIRDKFNNAAASIRWKPGMIDIFVDEYENYDLEKNPGLQYFSGRKIKVVPNYFAL